MTAPEHTTTVPFKVTTAANAQTLRDYAATKRHCSAVAIFPESGCSAAEQADFIRTLKSDIEEVITFSPFIISDAPPGCLHVLDLSDSQHGIKQADSVNRITMRLWRKSTIGAMGDTAIEAIRTQVNETSDVAQLEALADRLSELGDSVERHILLTAIYRKSDQCREEKIV